MIAAEVKKPGMLTTVQDMGRHGYRHLGIPLSGGIDRWSLKTANVLVGNDPGVACLEITMRGPELIFLKDCVAAVTGAEADVTLSGIPVPMWEGIFCGSGDVLTLGSPKKGSKSYLAVAGGLDVPMVLGSRSTYLTGCFGGIEGRRLQKGDLIRTLFKRHALDCLGKKYPKRYRPRFEDDIMVNVIKGINADSFTEKEFRRFLDTEFVVTPRSDRMGCSLEGISEIKSNIPAVSESCPVVPGSIQILPSGCPVVLLNDAQATGGYPQIACVTSADLWKIGQAVPGTRVFFRETDVRTARSEYQKKWVETGITERNPEIRFYSKTLKYHYEITLKD